MNKDTTMSQRLGFIGTLLRQDFNVRLLFFSIKNSDVLLQSAHRALHPLLLKVGIPRETVEEWSENAEKGACPVWISSESCLMWFALELMDKDEIIVWIRFIMAWGRRRAAPNMPAPSLPAPPPKLVEEDAEERVPYPHLDLYNTPEEALAESKRRKQTMDYPVPPEPQSLAWMA
jgi:hypothetical protein